MKNLVSIFAGHDANISFYNATTNKYYTIEIERLVKKRYFRLHEDNTPAQQKDILEQCRDIAEKEWGIENDYEAVLICSDGYVEVDPRQVFNTNTVQTVAMHHRTHAEAAFFMSPYCFNQDIDPNHLRLQAHIISYDGGGDDGHFLVHEAYRDELKLIKKVPSDFGGGYLLAASLIKEVAESSRHQLALAGKMMGLCAYGKVIDDYVKPFKEFYIDRDYKKLAETTGLPLKNLDNPWENPLDNWVFEGQEGYDIAATAQAAFEDALFQEIDDIRSDPNCPLILTGGCALNVLVNEKIKKVYKFRKIYVPPNPHDGGLSLGHLFAYRKPTKRVNITYSGLPLLDRDKLRSYIVEYNAEKIDKKHIAYLIRYGKIIGLVYGDSEVGPRALGNRSIVCDPNIADMKDILNSKVKFREWYRPFAPFCLYEQAPWFFNSRDFVNHESMSYAPEVKDEEKDRIPSVTHADGTARLQTVTEESHPVFYGILKEFGEISYTNVLLNTSFNIRGYPILSTIEDALYALNNTELDYVVIEDYLFSKKVK